MRLINVSDAAALKANNIPYSRDTLYRWHSVKKYPELFVKISRYLMIDAEAWERHIKKIMDERDAKTAKRTLH